MNLTITEGSLKVKECPICGADSGYVRRGYYQKCPVCEVAFREQHETTVELGEYWQEEFWTDEEIEKRKNREPVFRDAYTVLQQLHPDSGSVLDIGCGIGTFLAVCREGGWDVTGVEPSTVACDVARREYGLELINENFSSALLAGQKFDAVFAAQVLHHLPDPVAFIEDIDRVLADDGILMLRTPNLIPLEWSLLVQRLLGRKEEFFCGPALYTFHPSTLSLLFERLGYDEVKFVNSKPYLEMPAVSAASAPAVAGNLKRLSVIALKLATYGVAEGVHKLSSGRAVIGPSIFVVARKKK